MQDMNALHWRQHSARSKTLSKGSFLIKDLFKGDLWNRIRQRRTLFAWTSISQLCEHARLSDHCDL